MDRNNTADNETPHEVWCDDEHLYNYLLMPGGLLILVSALYTAGVFLQTLSSLKTVSTYGTVLCFLDAAVGLFILLGAVTGRYDEDTCALLGYLTYAVLSAAAYTISVYSIDCYFSLIFPNYLKWLRGHEISLATISVCLVNLVMYSFTIRYFHYDGIICAYDIASVYERLTYFCILQLVCSFGIPLIIVLYCSVDLVVRMIQERDAVGAITLYEIIMNRLHTQKQKSLKALLMVVITFYTTYTTYFMLRYSRASSHQALECSNIYLSASLLILHGLIYKPIIYIVTSHDFRSRYSQYARSFWKVNYVTTRRLLTSLRKVITCLWTGYIEGEEDWRGWQDESGDGSPCNNKDETANKQENGHGENGRTITEEDNRGSPDRAEYLDESDVREEETVGMANEREQRERKMGNRISIDENIMENNSDKNRVFPIQQFTKDSIKYELTDSTTKTITDKDVEKGKNTILEENRNRKKAPLIRGASEKKKSRPHHDHLPRMSIPGIARDLTPGAPLRLSSPPASSPPILSRVKSQPHLKSQRNKMRLNSAKSEEGEGKRSMIPGVGTTYDKQWHITSNVTWEGVGGDGHLPSQNRNEQLMPKLEKHERINDEGEGQSYSSMIPGVGITLDKKWHLNHKTAWMRRGSEGDIQGKRLQARLMQEVFHDP